MPMSSAEARALLPVLLGRIFLIMSRPGKPGDAAVYEEARMRALDCFEVLGMKTVSNHLTAAMVFLKDRQGLNLYND